ncbi:MAG: amidohydrolase family protein [Nitrospinaceae bacterium]
MKIKFRALLTFCDDPIENGELIIDEGEIVEISNQFPGGDDSLDLSDCLLMPGFVNAHCHISLTALEKKLSPTMSFVDWIRALTHLDSALDNESRVRGIRVGGEEMKRSGVTALGDYVAEPKLLKVIDELGFRSVLFLETLGFHSEKAQNLCQRAEGILNSELLSPLGRLGLAAHAPYSVSPDLFQCLKQLAHKYDCPFSCHVAETPGEVQFLNDGDDSLEELLKERSTWDQQWKPPGKTPIQYLNSLNLLERLVAIHCNFVSCDLDAMASNNVSAVFCPNSTQWFARNKIMPVRTLLDRGIIVALGTDSLASNDSLNFLNELRTADKLLSNVSRKEILAMATCMGGEALNLECGKLASGQKADLIGFRVPSSYSGSWFDVPFEPRRQKVDFYMVDGQA